MVQNLCISGIVLSGLALWAPLGSAQIPASGTQQPTPANPNPEGTGTGAAPKEAASGAPVFGDQEVVADTNALAGALSLTIGLPPAGHSFLLPSFGATFQAQANPYDSSQPGSPGVIESGYLVGRLALSRSSGRSNLMLDYSTGGSFSSNSTKGSYGIQNLHFSDSIHWGRWTTMVGEQFSYTPQSPFGFAGLGSLNNLGVGLGSVIGSNSGFQNGFLPSQSIFVDGSPQISNAVIGEVDYALSHRASLSFSGSYDLLDFVDAGFQNNKSAAFQGGYNYQLDRLNSIAVFYRFSANMPSGLTQGIQDHSVQLSYARRITGRMSLQFGGGPDVQIFKSPLAGPSTVVSWTASASLNYQYRHLKTGFSYNHSVTGGSGLLPGAQTDQFSGSIGRVINRDWEGSISTGYARNHAFQQTTLNSNSATPQSWFVTAQISRSFVRYGSLFIAYSASGQSSLASICTQPACQVSSLSNMGSIGYNWGLRPIVLE
jgi:hypothetical protein